jgi:hypothetical protein
MVGVLICAAFCLNGLAYFLVIRRDTGDSPWMFLQHILSEKSPYLMVKNPWIWPHCGCMFDMDLQ